MLLPYLRDKVSHQSPFLSHLTSDNGLKCILYSGWLHITSAIFQRYVIVYEYVIIAGKNYSHVVKGPLC